MGRTMEQEAVKQCGHMLAWAPNNSPAWQSQSSQTTSVATIYFQNAQVEVVKPFVQQVTNVSSPTFSG